MLLTRSEAAKVVKAAIDGKMKFVESRYSIEESWDFASYETCWKSPKGRYLISVKFRLGYAVGVDAVKTPSGGSWSSKSLGKNKTNEIFLNEFGPDASQQLENKIKIHKGNSIVVKRGWYVEVNGKPQGSICQTQDLAKKQARVIKNKLVSKRRLKDARKSELKQIIASAE